MILAFTGTRRGMTREQQRALRGQLKALQPAAFHHGCCVGADEEAVVAVLEACPGCVVHAHSGESAKGGANDHFSARAMALSHEVHKKRTHFARNRDLALACDKLVATPWQAQRQEPAEEEGGGTWYTVHWALKVGKPVVILWPDGEPEPREGA